MWATASRRSRGATAIAGTVLGVSSFADYESAKTSCAPNCDPSAVDGMKTRAIAGDVMIGAGLVTLGVATWMLLSSPSPSAPRAASSWGGGTF